MPRERYKPEEIVAKVRQVDGRGTVIYDFGMNNGDNIEYYLKKDFKVVGVDANPKLCSLCSKRFAKEVAEGRLVILNFVLSGDSSPELATFYIHKQRDTSSQFAQPDPTSIAEFEAIQVPQRKASEIVLEHGTPHYIKIDLEGMDGVILADLFKSGILPDFISAEALSVEPFALLVSNGYESFNLVDGLSVYQTYANVRIATPEGYVEYSFKDHSAGPYGQDIITPWLDSNSFFYMLASERLGWKDIHASRVIEPHQAQIPIRLRLREHLKDLIPSLVRAVRLRLAVNRRRAG